MEWFIRKSIASERLTPLKTIENAITSFIAVEPLSVDVQEEKKEMPRQLISMPLFRDDQTAALRRS
jgi:hypothetical protein